jgi:fatty-acid desaturase
MSNTEPTKKRLVVSVSLIFLVFCVVCLVGSVSLIFLVFCAVCLVKHTTQKIKKMSDIDPT